jgi:hypothetical protein
MPQVQRGKSPARRVTRAKNGNRGSVLAEEITPSDEGARWLLVREGERLVVRKSSGKTQEVPAFSRMRTPVTAPACCQTVLWCMAGPEALSRRPATSGDLVDLFTRWLPQRGPQGVSSLPDLRYAAGSVLLPAQHHHDGRPPAWRRRRPRGRRAPRSGRRMGAARRSWNAWLADLQLRRGQWFRS